MLALPRPACRYLDVEVVCDGLLACLLQDPGSSFRHGAVLVAPLDLDYSHQWRGLCTGGPGTIDAVIQVGGAGASQPARAACLPTGASVVLSLRA